MSTTANLVAVYFAIGLLLMTIAIAKGRKGHREDSFTPVHGEDSIGAGLFIFVLFMAHLAGDRDHEKRWVAEQAMRLTLGRETT